MIRHLVMIRRLIYKKTDTALTGDSNELIKKISIVVVVRNQK